jgi:hypothetical protein
MMNDFESGALCPTNQRSAAGRVREDGYSYSVRFMGRFPAGLATHLWLRHIPALAFGRLTGSTRQRCPADKISYQGHQL